MILAEEAEQDSFDLICDRCSIVGPFKTEEIQRDDIEFFVMRMKKCGHGLVFAVKDDRVRAAIEDMKKLTNKRNALMGSGDTSGLQRTLKKIDLKHEHLRVLQCRAWRIYGEKITEEDDLPAAPHLIEG